MEDFNLCLPIIKRSLEAHKERYHVKIIYISKKRLLKLIVMICRCNRYNLLKISEKKLDKKNLKKNNNNLLDLLLEKKDLIQLWIMIELNLFLNQISNSHKNLIF